MPLFKPRRSPLTLSQAYIGFVPSGTTQETADSYTIPANTFGTNGDCVEIEWIFQQTVANSCTIAIDTAAQTHMSDARSTVCDRSVLLKIERVNSTTVRRHMRYLYGTSTIYNPAVITAGVTDALATLLCEAKVTNSVAAGDMRLISRRVVFYPAVT